MTPSIIAELQELARRRQEDIDRLTEAIRELAELIKNFAPKPEKLLAIDIEETNFREHTDDVGFDFVKRWLKNNELILVRNPASTRQRKGT